MWLQHYKLLARKVTSNKYWRRRAIVSHILSADRGADNRLKKKLQLEGFDDYSKFDYLNKGDLGNETVIHSDSDHFHFTTEGLNRLGLGIPNNLICFRHCGYFTSRKYPLHCRRARCVCKR